MNAEPSGDSARDPSSTVLRGEAAARHLELVKARDAHLFTPDGTPSEVLAPKMGAIRACTDNESRKRLFRQAQECWTPAKKVHGLRKEAELVLRAVAPLAACRRSCSHRCHIAVAVSEPEAKVIAQEAGLTVKDPPRERSIEFDLRDPASVSRAVGSGLGAVHDRYGAPCPMLRDGDCGIYEARPLVCRHTVNFDDDDLLCKLVEGQQVSVPYLDNRAAQVLQFIVLGVTRMADIRDWFDPIDAINRIEPIN